MSMSHFLLRIHVLKLLFSQVPVLRQRDGNPVLGLCQRVRPAVGREQDGQPVGGGPDHLRHHHQQSHLQQRLIHPIHQQDGPAQG